MFNNIKLDTDLHHVTVGTGTKESDCRSLAIGFSKNVSPGPGLNDQHSPSKARMLPPGLGLALSLDASRRNTDNTVTVALEQS